MNFRDKLLNKITEVYSQQIMEERLENRTKDFIVSYFEEIRDELNSKNIIDLSDGEIAVSTNDVYAEEYVLIRIVDDILFFEFGDETIRIEQHNDMDKEINIEIDELKYNYEKGVCYSTKFEFIPLSENLLDKYLQIVFEDNLESI